MILLDARALMHHSYHSGEDPDAVISALGNTITTAEFGFNRFMERYMLPILEDDAPIEVLVAHDAGTKYRTAVYPEYKKSKSRTEFDPEEKAEQTKMFDMMKRFWAAMGCTQAKVNGVEADDLLAYFCQTIPGHHDLYTVDADLLQLQGDHANVSVLLKCEYQDNEDGHKGIPYAYTSFSKSLLGDTSDNYGGITGFGPAKWKHLVDEYGYDGLDELQQCVETKDYSMLKEAIAETGDKVLQMLFDNRDEWRKSWDLAKLHPELCWKPHAANKVITEIEWFKQVPSGVTVNKVFNAMGCKDLIEDERIEKWLPVQWLLTNEQVDEDLFTQFEAECKKSPVVSFDYETYPSDLAMKTDPKGGDYVDVKEALVAGASFTFGENLNTTFYIPINHRDTDNAAIDTLSRLLRIAEDHSTLAVQNASFEVAVTRTNMGFWLKPLFDTKTMQSYVNETAEAGLKAMSKEHLGYHQASYYDTVWSEGEQRMRTMDELTGEEVVNYGCDDAIVTGHLFVLFSIILKIEGTFDFVEKYESCSQHSLVSAYLKGAPIDWDALEVQRKVDVATIEENFATLRALLTEHCSSPNEKHAKAFVSSQRDYLRAVAKETAKEKLGKKPGDYTEEDTKAIVAEVEGAVDAFYKKSLRGSMYEPYETYIEAVEFKPTAAQFKDVVIFLGFEQDCFASTSRKAVSEWLVSARNIDFNAPRSESRLTADQERFCHLLGEAQGQLAKREGDEYDKLVEFCAANRVKSGKEMTTGDELNTGSPIQMQHLIYCKLGFPVRLTNMVARGSKRDELGIRDGSPQTDALAMDTALAEDTEEGDWRREAVACIKAIKESKTRISLYHDSYPLWKHPSDGNIHPQIKICGTVTRRPSGTQPNILQVSKHQAGGVMRSVYIPRTPEERIVSIDFSQQELRIMASESGDANLISCYVGNDKRDVHSLTAAGIAKVSYTEFMEAYSDREHAKHKVMADVRKRPAKATNFLFAYLGEAHTLSQRLIIPFEEADQMMQAAYSTYPDVQPWQLEVIDFARKHGYSKTVYGNRRHIMSDIFSNDNSANKRMQRQAVNAVIQNGAADILKIVLTNCWTTNLWESTGSTLLAPVYDEITASVPTDTIVEYIDRLVEIMEITPPGHVVPMVADVSLGKNWRDQIEIGVRPSADRILAAVKESYNG